MQLSSHFTVCVLCCLNLKIWKFEWSKFELVWDIPILGRFLLGMITTTPLLRTTNNDNNNNDAFQLPLFRGTCSFCGVYYSKLGFFYTPFIVFHDPLHPDEASIWGFDCKDGYHGSLSGASSVGCLCFEEKSNGFFEDFQREGWGVGWTLAFLTSQKKLRLLCIQIVFGAWPGRVYGLIFLGYKQQIHPS